MKIKKIEWKNFGSYGNKLQSLEFTNNEGNFYLVLGQNGSGKSTISDVIKFSLYGKLQKKKLKDIPNRFNGAAWCRITLDKDAFTEVIIERGVNPGILNCFVNAQEYDQAGKRNVQQYIEEEVIGLPFYVFNNIISLSINDFKSFLSMRPSDKRAIIDKIFSLEIINRIRTHVKSEIRKIRDSILVLDKEIDVLTSSMINSENELRKLEEFVQEDNENKISEYKNKIVEFNAFLDVKRNELVSLEEKKATVDEKNLNVSTIIKKLQNNIYHIEQREKVYENDKCPTCESDLTTDDHKNRHDEWLSKKSDMRERLDKVSENKRKIKEATVKIENVRKTLNAHIQRAKINIESYQKELKKLDTQDNDKQTEYLGNIINDLKSKQVVSKKRKGTEEKKSNFFKILEDIFGDKGVKQLAIKRILPSLNTEINRIIKELNMEYRVMFNEEFDAEINHLGYPVSSDMLSTGERKKVDFAVLISLIRLMKLKFQGLNIIFLDEIFSSIDSDGIHHILKILANTCKELNLNTFVINHSQLPVEIFDYTLNVEKTNNFSNIELEKVE